MRAALAASIYLEEPVGYADSQDSSFETRTANYTRTTIALPPFELSGPRDAPVVVALGGISASRHVTATTQDPSPGWWENTVGAGRAIDTTQYRVLSFDYLDGHDIDAANLSSPISTYDQADALLGLLGSLDIRRVHAIVGASYGGMVALAFAERYGERVEQIVAVSAAHQSHPMSTGIRAIQRRIVTLGVETGRSDDALALARALAMTTYRSAREFADRFDPAPEQTNSSTIAFPVENYLMHHGNAFVKRFSAERFVALSLSTDLHCINPQRIRTPAVLVAVDADTLVPREQIEALAADLAGPHRLIRLDAITGHDAFLAEPDKVGPVLRDAINTTILSNCGTLS